MSYGYSMPAFSCNSVFGMGMSFAPVSFAPVMPMPMFGGCCGGFGNGGCGGSGDCSCILWILLILCCCGGNGGTLNTTNKIINNNTNSTPAPSSNTFTSWMPTLNTNYSYKSKKKTSNYTFHTSSFNTKTNLPALKDVGYNSEKGYNLAKSAAGNAVGFTHKCAKYVRIALENTGLSNGQRGDGYQYADILSNNSNFKEISANNINLSSLPAGCVLVYDRGVAGYDSSAGHVEITLGNGQAVSDGVTNNIRQGARVFVPV